VLDIPFNRLTFPELLAPPPLPPKDVLVSLVPHEPPPAKYTFPLKNSPNVLSMGNPKSSLKLNVPTLYNPIPPSPSILLSESLFACPISPAPPPPEAYGKISSEPLVSPPANP